MEQPPEDWDAWKRELKTLLDEALDRKFVEVLRGVRAEFRQVLSEQKEGREALGQIWEVMADVDTGQVIEAPAPSSNHHVDYCSAGKQAAAPHGVADGLPQNGLPQGNQHWIDQELVEDEEDVWDPRLFLFSPFQAEKGERALLSTQRSVRSTLTIGVCENEEGMSSQEYENLYDLVRVFHSLCRPNRTTISVQELVEMRRYQMGWDPMDPRLGDLHVRVAKAIQEINNQFGLNQPTEKVSISQLPRDTLGAAISRISMDTFLLIMQRHSNGVLADLDNETIEAAMEIRNILVREEAFQKVAKVTNLSPQDMASTPENPSKLRKLMNHLDPFIGLVILLNAMVVCISTDVEPDSKAWIVLEFTFTVVFILELTLKLFVYGLCGFFLGPEWCWNDFDTCVVVMATIDLGYTLAGQTSIFTNLTFIRLLRFARLTKLVRVLKLRIFNELRLMVNGIFAGLRTLAWAVVFLGFLLVSIGVALTQVLGPKSKADWLSFCAGVPHWEGARDCQSAAEHLSLYGKELFGGVFRSVFTVFRCFTDGCSSVDGTPLIPYFFSTYGSFVVFLYMIIILFVLFGLFNLIMAIFVQNTIDSAKSDDAKRRQASFSDHIALARRLQDVIIMFCTGKGLQSAHTPPKKTFFGWFSSVFATTTLDTGRAIKMLEETAEETDSGPLSVQVTQTMFNNMLAKPEVRKILEDLEIDCSQGAQSLFEILDANGNSTLDVNELAVGLLRLRGVGDRADSVASLLAIRSIQQSIKALEVLGLHQQRAIEGISSSQGHLQAQLARLTSHASKEYRL